MGNNPINYWLSRINALRTLLNLARQNHVAVPVEVFFPNGVRFVNESNRYTDNENNRLTYYLDSQTLYPQVGENKILGRIGNFDILFVGK